MTETAEYTNIPFTNGSAQPDAGSTPGLDPAVLAQVALLNEEEKAERPRIWKACEDYASNVVRREAASGTLDDFAKMGERRELLTRKYAVEQLVNYGLSEGMRQDDFTLLFYNVLGPEGYETFKAGKPPERAVIDDLRARVYLITQFRAPGEDAEIPPTDGSTDGSLTNG